MTLRAVDSVDPNAEIVEKLEMFLERARRGEVQAFALVAIMPQREVVMLRVVGDLAQQLQLSGGMHYMANRLIDAGTETPYDPAGG